MPCPSFALSTIPLRFCATSLVVGLTTRVWVFSHGHLTGQFPRACQTFSIAHSGNRNYIGSACLYTPLVTQLNQDVGILLTYILMSSVYYGNVWRGKSYPFMSQAIFDTDGNTYNQTAILTNNRFDQEKYDSIGPAWFSSTNALFLLVDNLSIGAAIVHAGLFYGKDLYPLVKDVVNIRSMWKQGWRNMLVEEEVDPSTITDEHL